jgi:hypothetical protein
VGARIGRGQKQDERLAYKQGPDRVKGSNANEAGEKQDECPKETPPVEPRTKQCWLGLGIGYLITDHFIFSSQPSRSGNHNT